MKKFIINKSIYSVVLSAVLSFAFVTVSVFASSTISTNISTDGTLTVSGISTMNGALHASSTLVATDAATLYGTTTIMAQPLVLGLMATNPDGQTEGTIFYDSTSKIIKLYDGTDWFTVATSTGGAVLSGSRIQFSDLATNFVTFGTTTPQGASVVTLEATSTLAIPLSLVGYESAEANLFQIKTSALASTNLFYITGGGNVFATGTAQFTGAVTTYGSDILGDATGDTLTINGGTIAMGNVATTTVPTTAVHNIWSIATSTTGTPIFSVSGISSPNGRVGIGTVAPATTLEVVGTASSTNLIVGGDGTNGNLAGMIFGTCDIVTKSIAATSTAGVACTSATGITTSYKVFVQATSSLAEHLNPANTTSEFVIIGASSTAVDTIGVQILNQTGEATSTYGTLNFWAVR
jgi:hypothetical protein